MSITGILVLTVPAQQAAVVEAVRRFGWADVHQQDPQGRLIVTVESSDSVQGQERLKALKAVAGVVSAEMIIHCFEDEVPPRPDEARVRAYLNRASGEGGADDLPDGSDESAGVSQRSYFQRLKAFGNF